MNRFRNFDTKHLFMSPFTTCNHRGDINKCFVSKFLNRFMRIFLVSLLLPSSRYFEWQSRYLHYFHARSGTPGRITRLLSSSAPDFLTIRALDGRPTQLVLEDLTKHLLPTHVATPPKVDRDPNYTPYNKPSSVIHWLSQVVLASLPVDVHCIHATVFQSIESRFACFDNSITLVCMWI